MPMKRYNIGILLIAFAVLMLQLVLIRLLDVIWHSNMGYLVITLALFSFGVSGVYYAINPLKDKEHFYKVMSRLCFMYAASIGLIFVSFNYLPFRVAYFEQSIFWGLSSFLIFFFSLSLPFFFAGLLTTVVFSAKAKNIQLVYFYDLVGAGLGTVAIIPLIEPLGVGGIVLVLMGVNLVVAGIFAGVPWSRWLGYGAGAFFLILPFAYPGYIDLGKHVVSKRAIVEARDSDIIEYEVWDPISKIDVADLGGRKHIYYDGGSQSSYVYRFDGDYDALRALMPDYATSHFWERHVIVSHYLKQDTDQTVMVLGSAGGQEIKGALTYGARHVDAVELVGSVVELMATEYEEYSGGVTTHPNVNNQKGEGRSFLRHTELQYDIVQIFSNHTSSSIASGNGALSTNYLQTVEAYKLYFNSLKDDGILHINHHVYPRMVVTAARAWKEMGREDFLKHVIVWEAAGARDDLPAFLIKMTPWTQEELDKMSAFFANTRQLRVNPIDPSNNYLPAEFFTGDLPQEIIDQVPYRISAVYDNDPYFNFLRKSQDWLEVDARNYTNKSIADLMNSQLTNTVSNDIIHMVFTAGASVFFCIAFVFVPLFKSEVGRARWENKVPTLIYFCCLGAGFIIYELVLIQKFLLFIGYPLYTYGLVLFSLLFSAGLGSYCSELLKISPKNRWSWPFYGIFIYSVLWLTLGNWFLDSAAIDSMGLRILVSFLILVPLGFVLGMPFPLGIVYLSNKPSGGVAWAWAMNGLFTVFGGVIAVIVSIFIGFNNTLLIAFAFYALAYICSLKLSKDPSNG